MSHKTGVSGKKDGSGRHGHIEHGEDTAYGLFIIHILMNLAYITIVFLSFIVFFLYLSSPAHASKSSLSSSTIIMLKR